MESAPAVRLWSTENERGDALYRLHPSWVSGPYLRRLWCGVLAQGKTS
jgi:hypothetical protein